MKRFNKKWAVCLLIISLFQGFTVAQAQMLALPDLLKLMHTSPQVTQRKLEEAGYQLFDQFTTDEAYEKVYLSPDGETKILLVYPLAFEGSQKSARSDLKPVSIELILYTPAFDELFGGLSKLPEFVARKSYADARDLLHQVYISGRQSIEFISEKQASISEERRHKVIIL